MNEVTIPLKLTGIAAIKAELKSLKDQMVEATDPAQMAELADKAGALQQKLASVNKQIGEFGKGSNIDQVKGSFEGLSMSFQEMDFSKASKEAANLNQSIKSLTPGDLTKQFKGFAGTIVNLGKTFVSLGVKILTNPMFFLAAIITGIVAAIIMFLDKIGFLEKALNFLMKPINALIGLFKKFTDEIGLTNFAAEEHAKVMEKTNERAIKSSEKRVEKISDAYDIEIAKAKAAGKDTTDLELSKSRAISKEAQGRLKNAQEEYAYLQKIASKDNLERRKKLREQMEAERKILKDGRKERTLLQIDDDKEEADKAKEKAKKQADNAKAYAKNRLDAERTIKDIEIALIENDTEREIATTNEKYRRLIEDVKKNENLTGSEKVRLTALYEKQRIAELDKAAKTIADAEKKRQTDIQKAITDNQNAQLQREEDFQEQYRMLVMSEKDAELDAIQTKYFEAIALAEQYGLDTKTLEEKRLAELKVVQDKYTKEENQKRLDSIEKAKAERDAKLTLASDIVNGIGALGNAFIKDQKKLEQFNKASALVQIGIDTAKAISALVAASQSNPFNGVSAGAAGIAQFASGIIQITTNIAKAKQLLSNPSGSVSAGGGGGNDTASSSSAASIVPQINLFGQGNNLNTAGQPKSANASPSFVVQAVVSETDITSTQTKINKIKQGSEL
jgi:hypothetical protein